MDRKKIGSASSFVLFTVDQVLHIAVVVASYFLFHLGEKGNAFFEVCRQWAYFREAVIAMLILAIICDPAAIFIQKLIALIFSPGNGEEQGPGVGKIIGKLERVIISTLNLFNQPGAVGFVLTAKSIARYKQLEDQGFAERYLVGTLLSASIALITAIILKSFI